MDKNKSRDDEKLIDEALERQLSKYKAVEIKFIKTKKHLTEKMRDYQLSKTFIRSAPKLLDEFTKLHKEGADVNYNILIINDYEDENSEIANLVCGYLSHKGVSSNNLLTDYDYDRKIYGKEKYCSVVKYDRYYISITKNNPQKYKNIFTILLISSKDYEMHKTDLAIPYSFVLSNQYEANEKHNKVLTHIHNMGFKLEKQNTLRKLISIYYNVPVIKAVITKLMIEMKMNKQEQIIRFDDVENEIFNITLPESQLEKPNEKNNKKNSVKDLYKNVIGLQNVKNQVNRITKMIAKNKDSKPTLHMAFLGNPGTGKTTIARIIAKDFYDKGIIESNRLIEVSRADLVGEYIGQTAVKVEKIIEKALGGVLFIDEAYSLAVSKSDRDFGREALASLVKEMENYRDDLVIIFAGYEKEMLDMLSVNKGLESRIPFKLKFEDYSTDELMQILDVFVLKTKYEINDDGKQIIKQFFEDERKQENFSNGRFVRNFFEKLKLIQAETSAKNNYQITTDDILIAINEVVDSAENKKIIGFGN